MADGKEIIGTRGVLDVINDGWGNTVLHNYVKYDLNHIKLSEDDKIRLSNKWIVMTEPDEITEPEK